MHKFIKYVNPELGSQLKQVKMDKQFVKGEGSWLYDSDGVRYLDFIASYGALPFGYNHPEIWEAIEGIHLKGEPSFIQPSALDAAGELAEMLVSLAPGDMKYVTFTNSGAEAVEASIKLARSTTLKSKILATRNGFHGKNLGALSATGREHYQKPFGAPVEGFQFIDYGDIDALAQALEKDGTDIAGFIVEPIQGEGGIILPPPGYLKQAKTLCEKAGVLFIADEIQTCLGRTGAMFACESEGVRPDIITIAKALSGGIFPIGACLSTENAYNKDFALKHSSTYAASTMGCRIGLKVLEMLTRDNGKLMKEVSKKGDYLKKTLLKIASSYPDIISEVRGNGLMIGIDFAPNCTNFPGSLIGVMGEQKFLTAILSSYLLNEENLRVAPTLNGGTVIRIEPSLTISKEQCDMALNSIEHMIQTLDMRNTASILKFLVEKDDSRVSVIQRTELKKTKEPVTPKKDDGRWAFLVHPLDMENYREFDESLEAFNDYQIADLAERWNDFVEPFVVSGTRMKSKTGATAYGEFVVVPRTTKQILQMPQEQIQEELKAAVLLAAERGAKIVGLGAYTSVASRGGMRLAKLGIPITTGNSYSVVSAIDAVLDASEYLGVPMNETTASVVGATGAIGRAVAILLSERVNKMNLVGNPAHPQKAKQRMEKICTQVYRHILQMASSGHTFENNTIGSWLLQQKNLPNPEDPESSFKHLARFLAEKDDIPINLSTSCEETLPTTDISVVATNSIGDLITPDMLKFGTVVCDMSRPTNLSKRVEENRPDVLAIDGGVIQIPGTPKWGWNFGFEDGIAYACMSETFLLSLEKDYRNVSLGAELNLDTMTYVRNLAQKHGFKLAGLRSFDRPMSPEKWEKLLDARGDTNLKTGSLY